MIRTDERQRRNGLIPGWFGRHELLLVGSIEEKAPPQSAPPCFRFATRRAAIMCAAVPLAATILVQHSALRRVPGSDQRKCDINMEMEEVK